MSILVDSSVWIDYFRGTGQPEEVDLLIEENLVATNDLILSELIPPLHLRKKNRLIELLREIRRFPISVEWDDIIQMQIICLHNGVNAIGIPDLIIAQNAIQNGMKIYASDKHFALMSEYIPLLMHGR